MVDATRMDLSQNKHIVAIEDKMAAMDARIKALESVPAYVPPPPPRHKSLFERFWDAINK